ncbi:MAG: metalloregulator ArsR/SmtB family transcription factor [Thermotaleaceae bacterium]
MKEYAENFKALADENRLKILSMLVWGELCACDIQDNLNLTQPTISHHMKILQQAGFVEVEKRGKWAFYTIKKGEVDRLCNFLKEITSSLHRKDGIQENCICNRKRCNCD